MNVRFRWEDGDDGHVPAHLQWQRGKAIGTDRAGWVRVVLGENRPAVSVRPQRVFTDDLQPFDAGAVR